LLERGELVEARTILEQAIEHQSIALRSNPKDPVYREFLANHYRSLANVLVSQGEHASAVQTAAEAPRLFPARCQESIRAAEIFSQCVPLATKDAQLTEDRQRTLSEAYGKEALNWLRDAVARGCTDLDRQTQGAEFDPIRGREDFEKLLKEQEGKTRPTTEGSAQ
jgi:tetratricopeptide (TPR) repeat protein